MGISGLLPALASITTPINVSSLESKRVAVDAYCWLHKAIFCCSMELAQNIATDKHIKWCLNRVAMLKQYNITPVIVFDGGSLPAKRETEKERRKKRNENKARALTLLRDGDRNGAATYFQRAVDITPLMAHQLIKALNAENVECIVAPYEADAQLAYLSLSGYVDAVISEDSDLLAYGCNRVIFKMDKHGNGEEINLDRLGDTQNPSFSNFTHAMFRQVCILAGCDYLPSIPGMGIKKAHALIKMHGSAEKALCALRREKKFQIPDGYEEAFKKAEMTFLHHRVFDPISKTVVHLSPLPESGDNQPLAIDFLGPELPPEIGYQIAIGKMDPSSYEIFEEPKKATPVVTAPQRFSRAKPPLPIQKNTISSYFGRWVPTPFTNLIVASVSQTSLAQTKKPFCPPVLHLSSSSTIISTNSQNSQHSQHSQTPTTLQSISSPLPLEDGIPSPVGSSSSLGSPDITSPPSSPPLNGEKKRKPVELIIKSKFFSNFPTQKKPKVETISTPDFNDNDYSNSPTENSLATANRPILTKTKSVGNPSPSLPPFSSPLVANSRISMQNDPKKSPGTYFRRFMYKPASPIVTNEKTSENNV